VGLLNPGGPTAQFKRNRCSISPVEVILQSGGKRQTALRIERPPSQLLLSEMADLLFMRHIAFLWGVGWQKFFSPEFVSLAQPRRTLQNQRRYLYGSSLFSFAVSIKL